MDLLPPDASRVDLRNALDQPAWICLQYAQGAWLATDRAPWSGRARDASAFMHSVRRRISLSRTQRIIHSHSEAA